MTRNQVTLVGRLGTDAFITTFENGSSVARYRLAINETENKNSDQALFYPIFAWGNTAEFLTNHCKKGTKVAISGRLVYRTYIAKSGEQRKVTEVEVRQVVKF